MFMLCCVYSLHECQTRALPPPPVPESRRLNSERGSIHSVHTLHILGSTVRSSEYILLGFFLSLSLSFFIDLLRAVLASSSSSSSPPPPPPPPSIHPPFPPLSHNSHTSTIPLGDAQKSPFGD